jgi:hypothetical protein
MPAGLIEEENSVSARSDFDCDLEPGTPQLRIERAAVYSPAG